MAVKQTITTNTTSSAVDLFFGRNRVTVAGTIGGGTVVFSLDGVALKKLKDDGTFAAVTMTAVGQFEINGPGQLTMTLSGATSPNLSIETIELPKA